MRKRAEDVALMAVASESAILQEVLENAPIGIARFDRELIISNCNSIFATHFERDEQSMIGTSICALIQIPDPSLWTRATELSIPFRVPECFVKDEHYWDLTVWPIKSRDSDRKAEFY